MKRERVRIVRDADSGMWQPAVLSVSQAATWLEVNREAAYKQIRNGEFPVRTISVNGRQKVITADLMKFLAGAA